MRRRNYIGLLALTALSGCQTGDEGPSTTRGTQTTTIGYGGTVTTVPGDTPVTTTGATDDGATTTEREPTADGNEFGEFGYGEHGYGGVLLTDQ